MSNICKLAGIVLALFVAPATAGDRAGINFIGYSTNGSYFAYEEFGIQDGSGFAYANLYVLDLNAKSWVKGAPFHVVAENDASTIASTLGAVRAQAQPLLNELDIGEPVDIAALNADGALGVNVRSLRFGKPGHEMADPEQDYELTLSAIEDGVDPPKCAAWGEEHVSGFSLSLTVNGKASEVYRDAAVPESRGCPRGYRLYAVVTPFDSLASFSPDLTPGMVAIVSVYSMGFEGTDRRFIAVPIGK